MRRGVHLSGSLAEGLELHGIGAFDFCVLAMCDVTELERTEQFWIDAYNARDPNFGYNVQEAKYYPRKTA